jgi:predicted Zn-dependent peptidase
MNRMYDQYSVLTPADVQQAAAKYLKEQSRTIVTLATPAGGKREGAR